MTTLTNARVVTPHEVLEPGWVTFSGPTITGVGTGAAPAAADDDVHDLANAYLLPGFVDLHLHGGDGASVGSGDPDEVRRAVAFHHRHGTTRMLAGIIAGPVPRMTAAAATLADLLDAGDPGCAGVAGIHYEGPFLSSRHRGAHAEAHLLTPDPATLAALLTAGRGHVRVVTLAPELPGGLELVRSVVAAGAIAAIGHSEADHRRSRDAFAAGARLTTHLFNAMNPLHHREPGLAGATLADDRIVFELINDGLHLHDDTVRIAFATAPHRAALVTDATPAAGMPDGEYRLEDVDLTVRNGRATLPDGHTLAGSTLTMDRAVRRAVHHLGLPLTQVAAAAATTPARLLGLGDRTGSIAPGKDADLVVLTPRLHVRHTVLQGHMIGTR
ncbi:N-acetylglucosamine-6-phosphate deacetylase [Kitasatospora sp. cg17-2]